MTTSEVLPAVTPARPRVTDRLAEHLPKIVLAPTFVITLFFVYGFILWTTFLSFTKSRFMPVTAFDGLRPYERLWANPNWWTALENLVRSSACSTSASPRSSACCSRSCSTRRSAPRACCARSTSTRWRSPSSSPARPGSGCSIPASASRRSCATGASRASRSSGSSRPSTAIYCIVIAAIWQSSGFVMAMFLAGLRGVDGEIIKAAQIDGASLPRSTGGSSSR